MKTLNGTSATDGTDEVIVYAGLYYGQVHRVLCRYDRRLLVCRYAESAPFFVNVCDTEPANAAAPSEKGGAR